MRYLLRSNCSDRVLSTLQDDGDTELENSDQTVNLMELTFCGERHIINTL